MSVDNDSFVADVARRAGIEDEEKAGGLVVATLETLADRLGPGAVSSLGHTRCPRTSKHARFG